MEKNCSQSVCESCIPISVRNRCYVEQNRINKFLELRLSHEFAKKILFHSRTPIICKFVKTTVGNNFLKSYRPLMGKITYFFLSRAG